jgi:hypothetical protein
MAKVTIRPDSIQIIKLTDEEYFRDYPDYVSNSKLSLIDPSEGGSVEKYNSGFQSSYSESFELGSAVHSMILQPEFYEISEIKKPSGKLGLFADEMYKYQEEIILTLREEMLLASKAVDYYANSFTENRQAAALEACIPYWKARKEFEERLVSDKEQIRLSEAMASKLDMCMGGINGNKKILNTLRPTGILSNAEVYNEYAIFAIVDIELDDGRTVDLGIKAKLDNFTINHETEELTLNDLKTTGKPVNFFMGNNVRVGNDFVWYDGSFQKFHYYRQMGELHAPTIEIL